MSDHFSRYPNCDLCNHKETQEVGCFICPKYLGLVQTDNLVFFSQTPAQEPTVELRLNPLDVMFLKAIEAAFQSP